MRTLVLFFIYILVDNIYCQHNQSLTSGQIQDFSQKLYYSIWQKDLDWLVINLPDSFLVGEAYSEACYCPREKVLSWFSAENSHLPSPTEIKLTVCSISDLEKILIFSYHNNLLFTFVIQNQSANIISLGVGKYLLSP